MSIYFSKYLLSGDRMMNLELTILGNLVTKAIPSISRAKADKFLESFMLRVKEINKNSKYLYRVSRIELFGSYITDAELVNDIDIGYQLVRKGTNKDKWREKDRQRVRIAKNAGVNFNSFIDELFHTKRIVQKYLKSRSPYISLHDIDDDGIFEIIETRQVFHSKKTLKTYR